MARCATCRTLVIFGGKTWDNQRFCSDACRQTAITTSYSEDIPAEIVMHHAMTLRNAACPLCGREGPNDFHHAWSVLSIFVMTFHKKRQVFGCAWCGTKHKFKYFLFTGVFGWWGLPWGLVMTPIFEIANFAGLFRSVPREVSDDLRQFALTEISEELRRRVEEDEGQ